MAKLDRRYGIAGRLYQCTLMLVAAMPQVAAAAAPAQTVLAYGDSLTAGYQLGPTEGFAPQLEKALRAKGRNVSVVNAGVSGDTTAQGKARLNWVLAGMKTRPDLVVLELGANDMLRGSPPATAKTNLDAMIAAFQAKGARVLLAGMLASPNLGAAYARDFNALYPALAKSRGVALYPFFMDGVAAQPKLQLGDGMHPNPQGVKVIVQRILPAIERELDRKAGERELDAKAR